ncbi:hypothetical protein BB559_004114 [Furculomyces boomerangus]|uniref:JmjC domain-containing protein n=2 Tax=Furculomyces boomerangus TaxID=61424 RepID=A0A2T9YGR0_9FUNG|nr:hypothetical protein BB559_004114 [Furculomyces boomerangus]
MDLPRPKNTSNESQPNTTKKTEYNLESQTTKSRKKENQDIFCVNGSVPELLEFVKDYSESKISSQTYTTVNKNWFFIYSNSCILNSLFFLFGDGWKCTINYYNGHTENIYNKETSLLALNVLNILDLTVIVAGAPEWRLEFCQKMIETIESIFSLNPKLSFLDTNNTTIPTNEYPIIRNPLKQYENQISLQEFSNLIQDEFCEPFIIKNATNHWPAFSKNNSWNNLEYLCSAVGYYRLVPIEIGNNYTESTWSQKLVYFSEYLEDCILSKSNNKTSYLAQHNLFKQSRKLSNDFNIPDYCYTDAKCFERCKNKFNSCCGNVEDVIINAWIGPKNTVTPLHYDTFHNLFCQVAGYKYVKLLSHKFSSQVYPYDPSTMLSNTSQVDAEFPNLEKHSEFCSLPFLECILSPGDLLYIPPKYWHYLRSLSVSTSISMWF